MHAQLINPCKQRRLTTRENSPRPLSDPEQRVLGFAMNPCWLTGLKTTCNKNLEQKAYMVTIKTLLVSEVHQSRLARDLASLPVSQCCYMYVHRRLQSYVYSTQSLRPASVLILTSSHAAFVERNILIHLVSPRSPESSTEKVTTKPILRSQYPCENVTIYSTRLTRYRRFVVFTLCKCINK